MAIQYQSLKSDFPSAAITYNQNSLHMEYDVTPSPLSSQYRIKLEYYKGMFPNAYVVHPDKLKLYPDMTTLPHVYSTPEQKLCLFYRKSREWNSSMFITNTIIPWASEWLLHYECWLATGKWHGGGIHIETEQKKQADIVYESDEEINASR